MLQLEDKTPFVSALSLLQDVLGIDTLYVAVKATFSLGDQLAVAEEQLPLRMADEFWGEPGESSLKYASDIHLAKPFTDVALVGRAHAPGKQPVEELDTALSVGPLRKVIHVVGDREFTGGLIGPSEGSPQKLVSVPLTYEHAFGGVHIIDEAKGKVAAVASNPVGRGFRPRRRRKEIKGGPAPNLLDPADPERPASYGFVAPSWEPRRNYAGTYDEAWERGRAPYLPADFDPRFFNAAHPDLITEGYLQGGEPVTLDNLSPRGPLRFALPRCAFEIVVTLDRDEHIPPLNLETVLFEPDDDRMSMLWRAAVPCDKKGLKVEKVEIGLDELVLDGSPV